MAESIEPIENYSLSKKNKPKSLFSKVGLIGCGDVGGNIARQISAAGLDVVFLEVSEKKIERSLESIAAQLDRMIDRWGMTSGEKRAILSHITGTTKCEDLAGCDFVIETTKSPRKENEIEVRKRIFKNIEKHVSQEAIIATTSTTLIITELSSELLRPERCISMHFLPYEKVRVVEVVRGLYASDDVYHRVELFAKILDARMVPVIESPGLISARLVVPLINEACQVAMEGIGSREDIDETMRLGFGLPTGPFALADRIGLDVLLEWMEDLYEEFGDIKYKASPLIKKLVRANLLGRQTGRGFFQYDEQGARISPKK